MNSINNNEDIKIQLKKEELDIAKRWVQTGDVKVYKKTFIEEKNFTIPIECEELVIEKLVMNSSNLEFNDIPKETIRIKLNEEQVNFTKHKVSLKDISIYKEQVEDVKHIEETLKREKIKIKNFSSSKITET